MKKPTSKFAVFIVGSAFMLAGQACHTPSAAQHKAAATALSAPNNKAAADAKTKNLPPLTAPQQRGTAKNPLDKGVELPDSAGPDEAILVYDHRGAYGPYAFAQFALLADGVKLRCQRQRHSHKGSQGDQRLQSVQFSLPDDEAKLLRERARKLWADPPAAVAQASTLHDLGTFTTTLRFDGVSKQVIVSGQMTLEPYPKDLMRQLGELEQRCDQMLNAAEIAVDKALPQVGAAEHAADPVAAPKPKKSE